MIFFSFMCFVYFTFKNVSSSDGQFMSNGPQMVTEDMCDGSQKTSSVEQFFNLIFSEFQHQPPICVCVQMCTNQPTYCYPNGCFRKMEPKKQLPSPAQLVPSVIEEKSHPVSFLVDAQSDFMENLLPPKYAPEPGKAKYDQQNKENGLFRDSFKDRYQNLFKYKKTPKLHLRYNLREQVKHMKSDVIKIEKIDVSKNKWPMLTGERNHFFKDSKDVLNRDRNFHSATILEDAPSKYQSKFFKRDLSKKLMPNDQENEVDSTVESTSFSFENLIENLIEHSFGPTLNNTDINVNVNLDFDFVNSTTAEPPFLLPYKRSILDKNPIIILNETTNFVLMNDSEHLESNKYIGDSKNDISKDVFNDMIESLSKHIEKNNNNNVEMMEQIVGHHINELTDTEITESWPVEMQTNITSAVSENDKTTTETISTGVRSEKESERQQMKKKSHQRLLKRLQVKKRTT